MSQVPQSDSDIVRAHIRVRGRVQGVGYRAFVRRAALRLALDGIARNLPDGRVEVIARGTLEALTELDRVLRRGPPFAQVTRVDATEWSGQAEGLSGFETG